MNNHDPYLKKKQNIYYPSQSPRIVLGDQPSPVTTRRRRRSRPVSWRFSAALKLPGAEEMAVDLGMMWSLRHR